MKKMITQVQHKKYLWYVCILSIRLSQISVEPSPNGTLFPITLPQHLRYLLSEASWTVTRT